MATPLPPLDHVAKLKCFGSDSGALVAEVFIDAHGFARIVGDETIALIRMGQLSTALAAITARGPRPAKHPHLVTGNE